MPLVQAYPYDNAQFSRPNHHRPPSQHPDRKPFMPGPGMEQSHMGMPHHDTQSNIRSIPQLPPFQPRGDPYGVSLFQDHPPQQPPAASPLTHHHHAGAHGLAHHPPHHAMPQGNPRKRGPPDAEDSPTLPPMPGGPPAMYMEHRYAAPESVGAASQPHAITKKKTRTNTPWTPAEEQRLKAMRESGNTWGEIAKTFPSRTEGSVKKHWYKDMHYAEFAEDETAALLAAIKDYDANKWKAIGQKLGKPAKACEQHAKEHLGQKQ